MITKLPLHTVFGQIYLDWSLGETHPMQPIRAKLATDFIKADLGSDALVIEPISEELKPEIRAAIESVHDLDYVSTVLDEYRDGHWDGENRGLRRLKKDDGNPFGAIFGLIIEER